MEKDVTVREARPDELAVAARHYLGMYRELSWPDERLVADWEARFVEQHRRAASDGEASYFVADIGGCIVGSAVALLRRPPSAEFAPGAAARLHRERLRRQGVASSRRRLRAHDRRDRVAAFGRLRFR